MLEIANNADIVLIADDEDTAYSDAINLEGAKKLSIQSIYTITPLAEGTLSYQRSNDGETWDDIDAPTTITENGETWFSKVNPEYAFIRIGYVYSTRDATLSSHNHIFIQGN
jgi:hypothetical protein